MLKRVVPALVLAAAAVCSTTRMLAVTPSSSGQDVTVHEWGTFTTVAGEDGRAVDWLPLGGPTDLPCFVERYQNPTPVVNPADDPYGKANLFYNSENQAPLDYETARTGLSGKVRMETPVLYFYAPRETTAHVRVQFPRGLMTEWYPHATVAQPAINRTTLSNTNVVSAIDWPEVKIQPAATPVFPTEPGESHYYAARETDAAPLEVAGQQEKFLFYRGVASFDVPMTAVALATGGVHVTNLAAGVMPSLVLFENRGGRLGYRVVTDVQREVTIDPPTFTGDFAGLRVELERMLVTAGLYPKEATAMVETWRRSWFEEGTRVFYVVPSGALANILPLAVTPAPAHVARVFVGRMEIMTPAILSTVSAAIQRGDTATIARYGRFLGPIADRLLATAPATTSSRISGAASAAMTSYLARASSCGVSAAR